MEQAVFLHRATALKAAERAALKAGAHPAAVKAHATVKPVMHRGALQGFTAVYRTRHGEAMRPVMEH